MATYYVKNGGSDAADGLTEGTAWATSAKVTAAALVVDDVVLFNKGDTFAYLQVDVGGTAGHPITFGAYGTGARPIFTNRTILSSGWSNAGSNRWTHALTPVPTQVFFDTTRGTLEVSQAAVTAPTEWFWDADVLTVYSTSDPATAFTTPGIQQDGGGTLGSIAAYDRDYLTFTGLHCTLSAVGFWMAGPGSHITLDDCEGSWCYYDGFFTASPTTTLTNCTGHDNARHGAAFYVGGDSGTVIGGRYYNNAPGASLVSDSGCGVVFYQATDGLVTGVMAHNNLYGIKTYGVGTDRITIRSNTCHDNTAFGIDVDNGPADNVVEDNDCYANATHQIAVELSPTTGTIVRFNHTHDGPALEGAAGIEVAGAIGTLLVGNQCYRLENGIALFSNPATTTVRDNTIEQITSSGLNLSFDNASITGVVLTRNVVKTCGAYLIYTGAFTIANFNSDHNTWVETGTPQMYYNGAVYDLAGWRAATGQDRHRYLSSAAIVNVLA